MFLNIENNLHELDLHNRELIDTYSKRLAEENLEN